MDSQLLENSQGIQFQSVKYAPDKDCAHGPSLPGADFTVVNVLYMNIRSLRNKIDDVKLLVESYANIHILIMTETWLYENEVNLFNIPNYRAVHSCREARGGGTVIYIHESMNYKELDSDNGKNCNWVTIQLIDVKVNICVVYRPPRTSVLEFCDEITNKMQIYK